MGLQKPIKGKEGKEERALPLMVADRESQDLRNVIALTFYTKGLRKQKEERGREGRKGGGEKPGGGREDREGGGQKMDTSYESRSELCLHAHFSLLALFYSATVYHRQVREALSRVHVDTVTPKPQALHNQAWIRSPVRRLEN